MAKKEKTLVDLFEHGIKDIYYAEKKILTALPKMAKAAQTSELEAAFKKHERETKGQVLRLERIFKMMDMAPKGKKCPGIDGILEEGKEVMDEFKKTAALDAGMITGAQAVEHYEICRYGTLVAWAQKLGMDDAAALLEQTLEEEKATDEALSALAEQAINDYAEAAE